MKAGPEAMVMGDDDQGQEGQSHEWGEAVVASPDTRVEPGDIVIDRDLIIPPEPVVGGDISTALGEDEPEGNIPPNPLWAMKDRRHVQWHLLPSHERHERIRTSLGSGDELVYVIDDGRSHVMLGRVVGTSPSGCAYGLIGRLSYEDYERLQRHEAPLSKAFDSATEIALCGVVSEQGTLSSNVFDVARYDSGADVPAAYRPGGPVQQLTEDLEITAY
jgi:hypothetical protein